MKLLFLSNGHGEDIIATRLVEQFQQMSPTPQLAALPIVGEGYAYQKLNVPIISQVQQMPSGGFIYQDRRELWRDIQGGLIELTKTQFQAVRQWGQRGGKIVAVGDIVPLFLAWVSGGEYAFVGTAKSEYYIQEEKRWFYRTFSLETLFDSIYFPWERWLMKSPRCRAVFPRDDLTCQVLQKKSIRSYNLGNPMMDDIDETGEEEETQGVLTILLLPGSRYPEAQRNWELILQAVQGIIEEFTDSYLRFLAAIAPSLSLDSFQNSLISQGWKTTDNKGLEVSFKKQQATLILTQQNYKYCLQHSAVGIAMAGTATEQFVGLGKPVCTFPGEGPQFVYRFAEAQTRLLGKSVILLERPTQVPLAMKTLLRDEKRLKAIAENGRERMGKSGASQRITQCLKELWRED